MRKSGVIEYIKSDLYRYAGKSNLASFILTFIKVPGFNFSVKLRLTKRFSCGSLFRYPLYTLFYFFYRRAMIKYGISIPYKTEIGYGLYIGHFGGIVVNSNVKLGNNINLSHNVTIGKGGRRPYKNNGNPVIMNNVYIGPGSVIVGDIILEDDVAIGANAFVNCDCEKGSTYVGVPAKKINSKGSVGLINNIWHIPSE